MVGLKDMTVGVPIFFIALAFACTLISTVRCKMFIFRQNPDEGDGAIFAGLFQYETTVWAISEDTLWVSDVCVPYKYLDTPTGEEFPYTLDSTAEAMQALSIAVCAIGGFFMILACLAPCCGKIADAKVWKGIGLVIIITCVLQGCTLMVQNSSLCNDNPVIQYLRENYESVYQTLENPNSCDWASGFKLMISAVAFWGVGGLLMMAISPEPVPEDQADS